MVQKRRPEAGKALNCWGAKDAKNDKAEGMVLLNQKPFASLRFQNLFFVLTFVNPFLLSGLGRGLLMRYQLEVLQPDEFFRSFAIFRIFFPLRRFLKRTTYNALDSMGYDQLFTGERIGLWVDGFFSLGATALSRPTGKA